MCTTLRNPSSDKLKSGAEIKKQLDEDRRCTLSWCDNPITTMTGPNNKILCREHQIYQREYGHFGRVDRPWSFSKVWTCSWCGYNPHNDPWFSDKTIVWESEAHRNQTMRALMVGDHTIRKADGGKDDSNNIKTLCQNCNSKKSNLNKDFVRTSFYDD